LCIVNSVEPSSWRLVNVDCDCGAEIVLTYHQVYYCSKYSCGCTRRPRIDSVDYSGSSVTNMRGNQNSGRTLVVLSLDHETQQWAYVCDCCAQISLVPRGMQRGLMRTLATIAGQLCPNYRPFVPVEYISRLTNQLTNHRIPGSWKTDVAHNLVPYYLPAHVKRDRRGVVKGLFGLPDLKLPDKWKIDYAAPSVEHQPVSIDADGFGEFEELHDL
jgi:hypothetical protein